MARKLQVKRGLTANLPTLAAGEFGFCTDTTKLYIGTGSTNVALAKDDDIPTTASDIGAAPKSNPYFTGTVHIGDDSYIIEDVNYMNIYGGTSGDLLSLGYGTLKYNNKNVYDSSMITYSTTDLTEGTSTLATGSLYFVYEDEGTNAGGAN